MSILRGRTIAERPRIRAILAMLLPILPTAMSLKCLMPAITLVTSSGMEVPKATIVRPITTGLMCNACANLAEPVTSHSAP